jgi:hypothetical protein
MSVTYRTLTTVLGMTSAGIAQTVYWDFNSETPVSNGVSNVAAGIVARENGGSVVFLTDSSPSDTYSGASGGSNALATAQSGALSTNASTYFQFSLAPDSAHVLNVTNLTFGTRSTGTGPQSYSIRSSLNGYAASLANGTLSANSLWTLAEARMAARSSDAGKPVSFRIYGYGGTGSGSSNWRIDDLTVWAEAIEPGIASPPMVCAVEPQTVRVGETLVFALDITPTDNDPVTTTNATASVGVRGIWSLINGVFSYTPSKEDIGGQTFTFTACDKDGPSLPITVSVNVKKQPVAAIPMTTAKETYTQTFDGLATNGTNNAWDNAADPLEAWYAYANASAITTYRTGTGSGTSSGLHSFGTSTTNADRSLGSLAGNSATYRYGVAFTNASVELAVTNLFVTFTAEQWRTANAATNVLAFDYCVTNAVLSLTAGSWHPVKALCFCSPAVTNESQGVGAVYRSMKMSAAVTRPIAPGQVVLLRWSDEDDSGSDHAFGIDDLSATWASGAVPYAIPVDPAGATEKFDELDLTAMAELPYHWRIESRDDAPRISGAYTNAAANTTYANAAGSPRDAGSYTFSASAAYDQAVGGLSSSNAAKTVTVSAKFMNAANQPLRRWTVRYAVEKYRNGTVSSAVRLLCSLDGESWTAVGAPTAFAADADTNGYAADARPGATVTVERQAAFDAPITTGGVFYLAWQIAAAESEDSANAQALAIDDVEVRPFCPRKTVFLVK